jgi:two-component system, chemotaxis family, protein-glutamate methylesterase/glutaminase
MPNQLNKPWRPEIIAIGSSTGGPEALMQIVSSLDRSIRAPILVAQHMPANFTEKLAVRLSSQNTLVALQAENDTILECGKIYIAPGDYHLEIKRTGLHLKSVLHQGPKENSCRPAVDVLFRSVAKTCGNKALAIVLTGMGKDGVIGTQRIRESGGQVWIQDEATCVIWGMPGAVAEAGVANQILPLPKIAPEINLFFSLNQSNPVLQ